MHFTLKQLRYFESALRSGSITRAAADMNISQSSITAAIDSIEQHIGAELFRRIPAKGLVATDTGKRVGALVAQFLEQTRVFESDLMSLSGGPAGTLRLACYAPTAPYVLPPLLKQVARDYPEIRIDLQEGDMHSINALLQSGAVDLALTYRREAPDKLPFTPLFRARPWALLPASSPLSRQGTVRLSQLAPLPMILLDLPGTEAYFLSIFASHDLRPNVVHTTKSSSVLRGLVASDFGYSILNICGPGDRDGRNGYVALPIADDVEAPRYGVACTPAAQRSTMVQAVNDICVGLAQQGAFDDLLLSDGPYSTNQ